MFTLQTDCSFTFRMVKFDHLTSGLAPNLHKRLQTEYANNEGNFRHLFDDLQEFISKKQKHIWWFRSERKQYWFETKMILIRARGWHIKIWEMWWYSFYLKRFYVTSKATALLQKCWNKVPLQMLNLQKVRKLDLRMCAFNPVQPLNLNFKKLFKN